MLKNLMVRSFGGCFRTPTTRPNLFHARPERFIYLGLRGYKSLNLSYAFDGMVNIASNEIQITVIFDFIANISLSFFIRAECCSVFSEIKADILNPLLEKL
jgi:hypothetical protein